MLSRLQRRHERRCKAIERKIAAHSRPHAWGTGVSIIQPTHIPKDGICGPPYKRDRPTGSVWRKVNDPTLGQPNRWLGFTRMGHPNHCDSGA